MIKINDRVVDITLSKSNKPLNLLDDSQFVMWFYGTYE